MRQRLQTPFEPPTHLLPSLVDMPDLPGVYTFHAGENPLPLYIGKSIHLRTRVRSHLRNPEEASLLRQATHISFIRTAGEMGALLLEAQRIKQLQPLYNRKLRRNRQLCAWRLRPNGQPEVVQAKDVDFATTQGLFGLFASRHAAIEQLHQLADRHGLCLAVLGLEQRTGKRPCFRHMVKKCRGACCGLDPLDAHAQRLRDALEALRVNTWPTQGAMGLVEQGVDMRQIHVVRNWCYLGSADTVRAAKRLANAKTAPGFDADGYQILVGPILSQSLPQVAL